MSVNRILTIPRNLDSLAFPLKSSIGLKYSSVALSSSLICLGTNTGSTYVFEKDSLKLVKFIASKGGSIEILHFSKDERLLAISDSTGIVTCLEVNESKYELKVTKEIEDHKGTRITALTWDDDSARLFIGDDRGIVTAVIVAPFKLPAGKFLSKSTIEVVVKGESPIVQLDYSQLKLLVSTTTRTLLCLTDKSKYQQVGSKPRDGNFGSCFLQYGGGEYPVIYAARPGSRLWEVDFNGQVLATHQFKYLLATAPTVLRGYTKARSIISEHAWDKPQSLAFPKLLPLCNRFLVTWSSFALYIIDASFGKIAGWYDEIQGIKDISCKNETVFIVNRDGQVLGFEFLSVKTCLKCLIGLPEYRQAAEVAVEWRDEILSSVESYLTIDFETVKDVLSESEEQSTKELVESLHDLIEKLQLRHNQVRSEIQERLNGLPNLDESLTPCDSGVEDNDEVRSNQSEVISETSSRLSLSRLSHVDVDRVLRKATNAVFSKIASSGFMKKALSNVRDEKRQRSASPQLRDPFQAPRGSISVDSSLPDEIELSQVTNVSAASSLSSLSQLDGIEEQSREMGNIEQKQIDAAKDGDIISGRVPHAKKAMNGKRRRKAKIVTVEFKSPEKDDIFKTTSYDAPTHSHIRRLLSADSASSYSQISDTKRKGSLPQHTSTVDSIQDSQVAPVTVSTDAHSNIHHQPNIIEKARLLVRKVIHTDVPTPLDVRSAEDVTTQDFVTIPGKLACLLVSEDAMKSIPKFVDITAVCRNKLRDSRVLFNSKTVKKILQDWAEKLAETVQEFSVAMADGIEKRNSKHVYTNEEGELLLMRTREEFFANLGAAFSEISNLAVLCFEAGIFPTSCVDLNFLEKQLIENDITFGRIRQEVNTVLNKDDSKDANIEDGKPLESSPHKVFFVAQNNDKCEPHGGILEAKNDNKATISDRKGSFDRNAEQDESTVQESLKEGSQQATEVNFDVGVDDCIHEGTLEKVELKSDLPTVESNESKGRYSIEAVRTLHGSGIANQTNTDRDQDECEALRLGRSPHAESSNVSHSSRTTFGTRRSVKVDELLSSSSEDNTSLNSRSSSIPSSPLRDYVNVPVPRRTCYLQDDIEVVLCASDDPKTCKSCREDACRACFVLRYFPLLDLSKIRTVLGWKQGCRWRTWLAYLIHLEDTKCSEELQRAIANKKDGKVSRLLYDSSNVELLFSCVRRLLPSSFSLVFDLCTEKDVQPWEVCFIYMIDVSENELLGKFLEYMAAVRRLKPSVNPLEDISVAMTVLYCSLKFTSNSSNIDRYYCECGAAREGAHLLPWTQKTFIDDVISVCVSKDPYRGLVDRAFDLCRRYGYWHGCIRILRTRQEHKQAFELISQLGDFDLVNQYFDTESFTITESDLKHLCSLTYHVKEDGTMCEPAIPNFIPTITNEALARLLVRELGPFQAMAILKSSEQDISDLSSDFYFDCMRVAEKEQQQRQIVHKMLEALNSEACIENKSMFQREIELSKNREISDGFDKQGSKLKEDPTYEDRPNATSLNHWGLNLSLASSICPCCTLLLCVHGASSSAGIVVFDCGHAYHRHCLPEESCLVCYYKLDPYDFSFS